MDNGSAPFPNRSVQQRRWLTLTRQILPQLAARHGWPVRLDHCFMRICLDHALGQPWHLAVRRPATRNLTDAQLAAAIVVAEHLAANPDDLPAYNRRSLEWRGKRIS